MELQSPPVIQIIAGCLLLSRGSGVRYAARLPLGAGYLIVPKMFNGTTGPGCLVPPRGEIRFVLNPRRAWDNDSDCLAQPAPKRTSNSKQQAQTLLHTPHLLCLPSRVRRRSTDRRHKRNEA